MIARRLLATASSNRMCLSGDPHRILTDCFLPCQAAVGIGDLGLAYQCFKIAVAINPAHAEAHTNLGGKATA